MDLNEIINVSMADIKEHNPVNFPKLGSMKTNEPELRLKMYFQQS